MQSTPPGRNPRARAARVLVRLLSIADLPGDSDDLRLRKRMGIAAGLITIVAPLALPLTSGARAAVGLALALGLAGYSIVNLVVLRRTKRFERYVIALIASGPVFVFAANALTGGILGGGAGWVWAFLTPAYAILALGPRRATPWHLVFVASVLIAVTLDPVIRTWAPQPPYVVLLLFYAQNTIVPLTITFLLLRYTDIRRRAAEERADELLTNAIPRSIADRLRHGESRIAETYPATTVVFADVAGFTPWTSKTAPDRLVSLLDDLFSRFDRAAADAGMEKIKTVGDAYMAVAGAPEPREDHADAAIRFARALIEGSASWRTDNGLDLEIRVGVASGPAVGGIIGQQRMQFDLWGATVNTASRMESSGVPARIQVAASTRDLVGDRYRFEPREVDVKGLGTMTAFLLRDSEP
jgi:adenylate cyclase